MLPASRDSDASDATRVGSTHPNIRRDTAYEKATLQWNWMEKLGKKLPVLGEIHLAESQGHTNSVVDNRHLNTRTSRTVWSKTGTGQWESAVWA